MQRTQTANTYVSRRRRNQTTTRSYGRNNNITIFDQTEKLGVVSRFLMLGGVIALLGITFLMNASKPTVYSSEIQKYDAKISELETKKSDLEVENARLTALSTIENSETAKNLKTPTSVSYAK